MEILAIIPARGGSKGIPKKNIINLLDKPLIQYTIEAAKKSKKINRIIVSTDNKEISDISIKLGVEVIKRPIELAKDKSPTKDAIIHAVELLKEKNYSPSAIITLQPTSPLRTSQHIDQAIDLFLSHPNADSLVSCIEVPHIFNPDSIMKLNSNGFLIKYKEENNIFRRQDKDKFYARNGAAIYITNIKSIHKFIFGGICLPFFMKEEESIDIDNMEDLKIAENYLKSNRLEK